MKIACLQFAPQVGQVEDNISRAEAVLSTAILEGIDLLVLPELAFTGYNFPTLASITPYLEPTAAGPSTKWARRTAAQLTCIVHVGYPELATPSSPSAPPKRYNSTVTVGPTGQILAHYRKAFLYETDERWASEGPAGFFVGEVRGLSERRIGASAVGPVAMGICMDINPYRFVAPWDAYEFAGRAREAAAGLVVLSMAWLAVPAGASAEQVQAAVRVVSEEPGEPAGSTVSYWAERFSPLARMVGGRDVVLVIANRCGVEGEAVYAGSSTVMLVKNGMYLAWQFLGRGEETCLVVDTDTAPRYAIRPWFVNGNESDEDPAPSNAAGGNG